LIEDAKKFVVGRKTGGAARMDNDPLEKRIDPKRENKDTITESAGLRKAAVNQIGSVLFSGIEC
jgi:hypothetical protein